MTRSRRILLAALLVPLAVLGSATASSADSGFSSNTEAASVAIPAQAGDIRNATSRHVVQPWGRAIRASAVATSSVTCDGCTGTAVTLQVVYGRRVTSLRADNVAAAWSSCNGCRGYALSLQVVIARAVGGVKANNRSLAVNVTCVDCRTAAAAVQIVVVSPTARQLSQSAMDQITALRDQLVAQLQSQISSAASPNLAAPPTRSGAASEARLAPPASAVGRAGLQSGADQIQQIVVADLHASTASTDVVVRTG